MQYGWWRLPFPITQISYSLHFNAKQPVSTEISHKFQKILKIYPKHSRRKSVFADTLNTCVKSPKSDNSRRSI